MPDTRKLLAGLQLQNMLMRMPASPFNLKDLLSQNKEIDMSTAYRNIDTLVKCGIIEEIGVAGESRHFIKAGQNKAFIKCVTCGNISDTGIPASNGSVRNLTKSLWWKVSSVVCYSGICQDCI